MADRWLLCSLFLALLAPGWAPTTTDPSTASIRFQEGAAEAGLVFRQVSGSPEKEFILESMSGGVALLDYDNDGWLDIYLVSGNTIPEFLQGKRSTRNALYRNRGDGTFEDLTARAGVPGGRWDMGAVAADIDNDGFKDLFVTGFGRNTLYRNNGDGTFSDLTEQAGLADEQWSTGAAFGDYDGDGLLDLAVVHYVVFDPARPPDRSPLCTYRGIEVQCGPRGLPGTENSLYRNLGSGRFQEVSGEVGIRTGSRYYGLGCIWSDYDNDGDLDLFVANDSCPNYLFRNDSGRFTEVAMESGVALNEDGNEQAGMGVTVGDVDRDGWLDLVQTNFSDDKNTLYRNERGFFFDVSYLWGIGDVSWQSLGWGALFLDADWDGWLDLFIANGHVYPQVDRFQIGTRYLQRDFLFRNKGGKGFREIGPEAGFRYLDASRGAAVGDLNNDGRLEVVVNRLDSTPALYWNETSPGSRHWIGFILEGTRSNRDGIGARVTVTAGRLQSIQEVQSGASYLSCNDPRLVFGLGTRSIEKIEVRWPSGLRQEVWEWQLDQYNRIVEPAS